MNAVRFHPAADEELLQATAWYLERSVTAATAFVREVEHAVDRIVETPERYPRTRFACRRFVLLNYPYDVVYRRLPSDVIEIVAVAHHARRAGYWRGR